MFSYWTLTNIFACNILYNTCLKCPQNAVNYQNHSLLQMQDVYPALGRFLSKSETICSKIQIFYQQCVLSCILKLRFMIHMIGQNLIQQKSQATNRQHRSITLCPPTVVGQAQALLQCASLFLCSSLVWYSFVGGREHILVRYIEINNRDREVYGFITYI